MDPYRSPYILPNNRLHIPFPHSLLRRRSLVFAAYATGNHGRCLPSRAGDSHVLAASVQVREPRKTGYLTTLACMSGNRLLGGSTQLPLEQSISVIQNPKPSTVNPKP